jgi:hypothetical protein
MRPETLKRRSVRSSSIPCRRYGNGPTKSGARKAAYSLGEALCQDGNARLPSRLVVRLAAPRPSPATTTPPSIRTATLPSVRSSRRVVVRVVPRVVIETMLRPASSRASIRTASRHVN